MPSPEGLGRKLSMVLSDFLSLLRKFQEEIIHAVVMEADYSEQVGRLKDQKVVSIKEGILLQGARYS